MSSPPYDSGPPEDGALVRPRQFELLVEGFGRLIAQAVRRVAGKASGNDLEDIQQDVMLALWKRLSREQSIDHPASYLYKAAIREAVRAVDRLRRRAEDPLGPAAFDLRAEPDAERAVEDAERQAWLAAAIAVAGGSSVEQAAAFVDAGAGPPSDAADGLGCVEAALTACAADTLAYRAARRAAGQRPKPP